MKKEHVRFSGADWYGKYNDNIVVFGQGGIGSWCSLFLSRNGLLILAIDMDKVDDSNLAGQLYSKSHINQYKTDAVAEICNSMCNASNVTGLNLTVDENISVCNISVSAFDNMKARRDIFNAFKRRCEESDEKDKLLLIDGRLLMETGQIYCVTANTLDRYEATLFDDSEIPDVACSTKATTFAGAHIASMITSFVLNFIANQFVYEGEDVKSVPFSYEFELPMTNFNIEY